MSEWLEKMATELHTKLVQFPKIRAFLVAPVLYYAWNQLSESQTKQYRRRRTEIKGKGELELEE